MAGLFGPESGGLDYFMPLYYYQMGQSEDHKTSQSTGTTSSHIQSICDAMEIPHIETRWDFILKRDDYSINLYPNPKTISKVSL